MANVDTEQRSHEMGLHAEQLAGRTQKVFFDVEEDEHGRFTYPEAEDVDFDQKAEIDAAEIDPHEVNNRIRALMSQGYGTITVHNPWARHSLGVGFLNRLNLRFEGSLGYYGAGAIDGPNVRVSGRVGWSCGENMMAGTVVVEKNAGSALGAGIRGGDLVVKGDVGARTGINQKGGTIIMGGRAGAFTGFMMQRGRQIILGDTNENLGDSMYDGTIFVAGNVKSLGVDAVPGEMTDLDVQWLNRKLSLYGLEAPNGAHNMQKIVAGKQLWNYDNLEPAEKKLIL